MAMGLMAELILDQCEVELKDNQDADSISEEAVLKINEPNRIRELCMAVFEITEIRAKSNWGETRN